MKTEEFLQKIGLEGKRGELRRDQLQYLLIEYAKIHVGLALEAAANNARHLTQGPTSGIEIDRNSILNAYPSTEII